MLFIGIEALNHNREHLKLRYFISRILAKLVRIHDNLANFVVCKQIYSYISSLQFVFLVTSHFEGGLGVKIALPSFFA